MGAQAQPSPPTARRLPSHNRGPQRPTHQSGQAAPTRESGNGPKHVRHSDTHGMCWSTLVYKGPFTSGAGAGGERSPFWRRAGRPRDSNTRNQRTQSSFVSGQPSEGQTTARLSRPQPGQPVLTGAGTRGREGPVPLRAAQRHPQPRRTVLRKPTPLRAAKGQRHVSNHTTCTLCEVPAAGSSAPQAVQPTDKEGAAEGSGPCRLNRVARPFLFPRNNQAVACQDTHLHRKRAGGVGGAHQQGVRSSYSQGGRRGNHTLCFLT